MSRSVRKNVLLISDSRGRGFDTYVERQDIPEGCRFFYIIEGGLDLRKIADKINQQHKYRKIEYTIVIGGICSLTEKLTTRGKNKVQYPVQNRAVKRDETIRIIDELKGKYKDKINICTIIPASLSKHYKVRNRVKSSDAHKIPDFSEDQAALLEDIEVINNHIKTLNASTGTPNIDFARRLYKNSLKCKRTGDKGRRKRVGEFCDSRLYDGIHLEEESSYKFFELIFNTIIRRLNPIAPEPSYRDQQDTVDPREGTSRETETEGDQREFIVIDEIGESSSQLDNITDKSDTDALTSDALNTTQESIDWGDFKRKKPRHTNSN